MNRFGFRRLTSCVLVALFGLPSLLPAQDHVVSPEDLHKAMLAASSARQRHIETIVGFLSSTNQTQAAAKSLSLDPAKVKTAVSSLTDEELARLAARAEKAQADFAAGRLSERDLLWILVGLAALILIIVAVH